MARIGNMEERHQKILDILTTESATSVTRLSSLLNVTKETIRKDLSMLEEQGKISRIHGGAGRIDKTQRIPFQIRESIAGEEKRKVAIAASKLICENDHVIIEGSTTNLFLCSELLKDPDKLKTVTVITDSLRIMQLLDNGAKCKSLILLGGMIDVDEGRARGYQTVDALKTYQADKGFISAAALNDEMGITAYREDDMLFQKQVLHSAGKVYVLVNHSKYPSSALYFVCSASELTGVVTDGKLSVFAEAFLKESNTDLIQA